MLGMEHLIARTWIQQETEKYEAAQLEKSKESKEVEATKEEVVEMKNGKPVFSKSEEPTEEAPVKSEPVKEIPQEEIAAAKAQK